MIQAREKYYLGWKEPGGMENPLDRAITQLCDKPRLLELIHDFIAFDSGSKKICRHNQYFGVRAAQEHIRRREGGVIWHTQGSGKSLTMVWLAKWIREHVTDARVLLITDRTELDDQIEKVFKGVREDIYRTRSGDDLVRVLNARDEWLICSLVHKFGSDEELSDKEVDAYVEGIRRNLPGDFVAKGDIHVFVDECHRTQSGKLHQAMKALLAEHFGESEESAMSRVETFEKNVKQRFIDDPGQMRLLIVVDKLLTGFDAPPATYLYIDKQMQDHGLFQAICRVNRLDGDDKEYGYIIDYKDLFKSLEGAIKDYTGEAFAGYDKDDVAGLLKDRLEQGRAHLDEIRESIKALCEPVEPPKNTPAYLRYFRGPSDDMAAIRDNEPRRVALYKLVASFLRAYADIANEMVDAGYSAAQAKAIKQEVAHYEKVREEVRLASGDHVDMKSLEPAMRHLLDTYIRAEDSEKVSAFDDMGLIDLIVAHGEEAVDAMPEGIRNDKGAMAETIESNVRRLIIDEMAVNPKYYEKMSELLDALIKQRKSEALKYKDYLRQIVELTRKVRTSSSRTDYPPNIISPARQALYDNLSDAECGIIAVRHAVADADARQSAVLILHDAIQAVKKADWRGNKFKEREVKAAIADLLGQANDRVDAIFELVKNQREY